MAISVEFAYAPEDAQYLLELSLADDATVAEALAEARRRLPSLPPGDVPVGIWGRSVPITEALADGDRVEVYRPLKIDPKEARRLRSLG